MDIFNRPNDEDDSNKDEKDQESINAVQDLEENK
jgi:hypothetical protein